MSLRILIVLSILSIASTVPYASQAADFATWRRDLWPDARAFGITRATFDTAFRDVEPDRSLPDLIRPATADRPGIPQADRGQAEFTRPPQDYVREQSIARLAASGQRLKREHGATLDLVAGRFGVPAAVVLAIFGRETAFGSYRLPHDAIRALATQAFMGRRAPMFRRELLFALKMLQDGVVTRARFRSSWAGAVGLTQFMPSEYDALAVDLGGDGMKDIWSVPDALASAANQLAQKGWVRGQPWGYEVKLPPSVTCAEDGPQRAQAIEKWVARGVARADGRTFSRAELGTRAFLFSPGGGMGPVFLATENFLVFKRYNTSDLYALFVGHLADRIAGRGGFVRGWGEITQAPTRQIEAIQTILKAEGFAIEKIDGRIGPNTRSQIGSYQVREKLAVTCWPSAGLLTAMARRSNAAARR